MKIDKINLFSISLLVAIFEAFGWFFLFLFESKNYLLGIIVAIPTTILSLLIYNKVFSSKIKIKFWSNGKENVINKINITYFAIANCIFLTLLFVLFYYLKTITENSFVQGFIGTFFALFILITIFNLIKFKKIKLTYLNPTISLYAGLTEGLILEIQFYLLSANFLNNLYLEYLISGFISGFASTLIIITLYNLVLNKIIKIQMEIK